MNITYYKVEKLHSNSAIQTFILKLSYQFSQINVIMLKCPQI